MYFRSRDFFSALYWAFLLMVGVAGQYLPREALLLIALFVFYPTHRLVWAIAYLGVMMCAGFYSQMTFGLGLNFHDFLALSLALLILEGFIRIHKRFDIDSSVVIGLLFFLVLSFLIGIYADNYNYGVSLVGVRFEGMAQNPNQLGLYALCVMLLAASTFRNRLAKYKVFAVVACFLMGLLSGSDAFIVAALLWAICALLYALTPKYWLFWLSFGVFIPAGYFLLHYDSIHLDGQSYERLNRWLFALPLLSDNLHTLITGLGLGAYGPPLDGVVTSYISVPSVPSVGSAEFHNSVIDFFVSFGAVGLVLLYFYLKDIVGSIVLSPSVVALLGFSCFHLTYRHPMFWVTLYLLLTESASSKLDRRLVMKGRLVLVRG